MSKSAEYLGMLSRRADQLTTRLALAVCIGLSAYFLKPAIWPAVWFAAVAVTQLFEYLCVDRPLMRRGGELSPVIKVFITGLSGFNAIIYAGLSIFLWFCGPPGQFFATMLICGSLLHVCLHLYTVREVQVSAATAPSLLLLGLPIAGYVQSGEGRAAPVIIIVISAALYMAHLLIGVIYNFRTNASLQVAKAEAEQMRRLAEAESESKSRFLATISHEIRTPLNAVTSAAGLLKSTPMSERQEEYVSILTNGSEVLLGLINQVLDLSKIEAGKMTLEMGEVDLSDLTDKLLSLWTAPAQEKGLAISVAMDPTLPPVIWADGLRTAQVLFNLVANALKFTDSGSVRVVVRRDGDVLAPRIAFEVIDTGPGIATEAVGRLFNNFEQAEAGTTRRFGGTGLGLAISRRLAELMDGALTVETVEGEGSTFRFSIPLVACERALAPAQPVAADQKGRDVPAIPELLIAEDHDVNRRIICLLLEPLNGRVTLVEDGAAAIEAASQKTFDAILMDHQMPVMSGLEATRRIRAGDGLNARTPIIALTADAFEEQRQTWIDAGADAFITKPIDAPLLLSTVIDLLERAPS